MRCTSFFLFVLLLITPLTPLSAKVIQWALQRTTGVRFDNTFAEFAALSAVACAYKCTWTGRCYVANYNSGTMTCTLIEDASTFVSDIEWDSFIVVSGMLLQQCMCFYFISESNKQMQRFLYWSFVCLACNSLGSNFYNKIELFSIYSDTHVATATATQSSLWGGCVPEIGIDGTTVSSEATCTHTQLSADNYWQTAFATYSAVRQVVLYLRSDCSDCKFCFVKSKTFNIGSK